MRKSFLAAMIAIVVTTGGAALVQAQPYGSGSGYEYGPGHMMGHGYGHGWMMGPGYGSGMMSYGYYGYGPHERGYGPGPRYRGQRLCWKETASGRGYYAACPK
jgi:hypothetical protein